jgi:glycosyltransferase involved in cell wall biosynthesis
MVAILLLGGLQLLSLGIIGEYLARVFTEVKARPIYFIADRVGFDDDANQ